MKRKKDLKDKKLRLILMVAALLLVSIGSTYAWWTASTEVEQRITMGNLSIESSFDEETHLNYEPGTYAEINGSVKNTGSIPAMIKINNSSQITFAYADDNLTPIEEANRVPEAVDSNAVQIDFEPQSGNYADNDKVFWFTHTDGHKYLLIEPEGIIQLSILVNFDGAATTNKYMDALVDAKAQVQATQVMEGAIASEFGIDASELISLPLTRSATTGQSRLQELLSR